LASRSSSEELKSFYMDRLTHLDFQVRDLGTGTLNAAAANYLGVANMLEAERPASGDHLNVEIGTPEGMLVASRLVKLHWYKSSNPGFGR
jgi:hypothetical protein